MALRLAATLQLLLAAGGVEHKQPQQPRWMVALFKTNAPEAISHGLTNTIFDVSPQRLLQAGTEPAGQGGNGSAGGLRRFLDLGFTYEGPGMKIWNPECDRVRPPASCGDVPEGCGYTMSGLQPGWQSALASAIDAIGPALRNRSIEGVFLGDELCGTANIPAANLTAVAEEAASLMARFGGGEIYANEAVRAVNDSHWGPQRGAGGGRPASACFLPRLPTALTLFSLDFYAVAIESLRPPGATGNLTAEAPWMENIYAKLVVPKLVPHQRLLVVPGLFADGDLARSGPVAGQDGTIATKLRGYKAWMERDDRIVGLNGYHWKDDGRRSANGTWLPRGDAWLGLGVKSLPRTQAVLAELAGAAGRSR